MLKQYETTREFPAERLTRPSVATPPQNPQGIAERIALATVEILSGYRSVRQLQGYVTHDIYGALVRRSGLAARCKTTMRHPGRVMRSVASYPAPGVCESSIVVHDSTRPRACAIRLEKHRGRWRATALDVI